MPLFNNLKITNLCNEGVCPEKVESVMNDDNMAKWMDFLLSVIDLLLNLIFFQRTDYLEALHLFLPYVLALNQYNYAANLSCFCVAMLNIEKNAPQAYQYLATGGFTRSLSGQRFAMIPMDQMIEMALNKYSVAVGVLSDVTVNKGAIKNMDAD